MKPISFRGCVNRYGVKLGKLLAREIGRRTGYSGIYPDKGTLGHVAISTIRALQSELGWRPYDGN